MEMEKEQIPDMARKQRVKPPPGRRKHLIKRAFLLLIIFSLIGVAAILYFRRAEAESVSPYEAGQVTRGNLMVSINATGTVEPEVAALPADPAVAGRRANAR